MKISLPFTEPPVGSLFGKEEVAAIRRVLSSGELLTRGKDVEMFEQEFAEYCGAPYAVAVSSCTAALRIAVQVLRLRKGDEVIVPANAIWNTIAALVERGVVLKVADVHAYSLTIDPASVERLITKKTKAIFLLSFGGNPCDMEAFWEMSRKHHIPLVEDAAHSAGAVYKEKKIGNVSDITCFSFATLKNISTLGEGGMFVTRHKKFAEEAKKLRESWPIGVTKKAKVQRFGKYAKPSDPSFMRPGDAFDARWVSLAEVGTNFKMSSVAAAVGRVQLKKLDRLNEVRRHIATQYDEFVRAAEGMQPLTIVPGCKPSWHLYHFFILPSSGVNRDTFILELKKRHNIHLLNRYWPIHLHGVLRMQGHSIGEAPVYERLWFTEQVALPIAPCMDRKCVEWLIDRLRTVYASLH